MSSEIPSVGKKRREFTLLWHSPSWPASHCLGSGHSKLLGGWEFVFSRLLPHLDQKASQLGVRLLVSSVPGTKDSQAKLSSVWWQRRALHPAPRYMQWMLMALGECGIVCGIDETVVCSYALLPRRSGPALRKAWKSQVAGCTWRIVSGIVFQGIPDWNFISLTLFSHHFGVSIVLHW